MGTLDADRAQRRESARLYADVGGVRDPVALADGVDVTCALSVAETVLCVLGGAALGVVVAMLLDGALVVPS